MSDLLDHGERVDASSVVGLRTFVLLAAVALASVGALVRPDAMVVEHVAIEGFKRSSEVELRHLADVRNGEPTWSVDPDEVREGVERHPWVRSAEVVVEPPDTVRIQVEEYEPAVLVHYEGELYYADRAGHLFLRARGDDMDYPVVFGVSRELELGNPELPRTVLRDALWLLATLDESGLVSQESVSEIVFLRTRGFTFRLMGNGAGAELLFGLQDYSRQVQHLAALIDQGLDLTEAVRVDLAPEKIAIVRPIIEPPDSGEGG